MRTSADATIEERTMFSTEFRRAKIDEDTQRMAVFPGDRPDLEDLPAAARAEAHRRQCTPEPGRKPVRR
ncbi:hypothetical protein NDR87_25135 [Nocardia sp. CDC159]|uniref:Uncharacterized protein n=1 Tax=Nocardia pulmonis TaxID=2951408 RepID=A0A9X2E7I5_9NOCA|nr:MULTISPECIES: hypothetical protein [Nocardia]MCM6775189.1 hypothetical protein [Nocardia pulmonis]MCM6789659.1 hypothetical protein [Nocardia sp. CDC159]